MGNKIGYISSKELIQKRKDTEIRINSIKNTPNMHIPQEASVYYISPNGNDNLSGRTPSDAWKSIEKLNNTVLGQNSYVCFERGGIWRGKLYSQNNVTYTAYGTGEKPKIYASPENAANPQKWTKTDATNVWKYDIVNTDIGTLVFDEGKAHAIKVILENHANGTTINRTTGEKFDDYHDIKKDLHFYHDHKHNSVYLYSEQNPAERFSSIEFNAFGHIFVSKFPLQNVCIDNLCLKYCGSHGIGYINAYGLHITNCEIGWIGGSIQSGSTRYGNGVEVWENCDDYVIDNCYFYQIYDAAVTHQFVMPQEPQYKDYKCYMKNIRYSNNVIEYSNYSIEYFINGICEGNDSGIYGFTVENNLMWYAGEGLCRQRPDKTEAAHIKSWTSTNHAKNYVIKNNLMCLSFNMLMHICSVSPGCDGSNCMPVFENNTVIGRDGDLFGIAELNAKPKRQTYNKNILNYINELGSDNNFLFLK